MLIRVAVEGLVKHVNRAFQQYDCWPQKCELDRFKTLLAVEHVTANCIQHLKNCVSPSILTARFQPRQKLTVRPCIPITSYQIKFQRESTFTQMFGDLPQGVVRISVC